eukprot:gene8456-17434_t
MTNLDISTDDLHVWLGHWTAIQAQMEMIVSGLRRRQITGALPCAKATLEMLRTILGQCKFSNTDHMMRVVRAVGRELTNANVVELTIGNIVRRVLYMIREEYSNKLRAMDTDNNTTGGKVRSDSDIEKKIKRKTSTQVSVTTSTSTNTVLERVVLGLGGDDKRDSRPDYTAPVTDMRQVIMAAISELNDELDNINQPICEVAQEYIHADECILTYGYSLTVELFLKTAAKKRKFQVIVAESGPSLEGHKLAHALSKNTNITIALIPDSAVYALMSRVNKVIFSPSAIMADGGAICTSGHLMVAVAAK